MKVVNLQNIKENYFDIIKRSKGKKVYFVLKADAYGLGIVMIAKTLISLGAFHFAVVNVKEALILRRLNKNINILLLSDFSLEEKEILKNNNICVTISSISKIQMIQDMDIEIKINTGMNRFGLALEEVDEALMWVGKNNLNLVGIYTHIGNYHSQEFFKQYYKFSNIIKKRENINIHFVSSKGLDLQMDLYNTVRVGRALYRDNSLLLVEKIERINYCLKDSVIGYNDYTMSENGYIGIINMGYSDGLIRANNGRLVYINQKYYKIVSICMNHTLILVDQDVKENDEVELIGENVKIGYVSNYLKTIDYEILTSFPNQNIMYK